MKKLLNILITLCLIASAVGCWMIAGDSFRKVLDGSEVLAEGESFAQAEGKYISYEAAYPVGSYIEEYYSGDPDRVRTIGYAVYDEDRQAFLYIVVSDRENAGLKDLMWNLHLAVELRAGKDMAPFTAQGTVEPMGEEMLEHVFSALGESEVIGLYRDFQEDAVYREAYFGDEHGQVMEEMCRALDQNALQEDWYYLKTGVVNGLEMADIWICILAAGLSLLLAIVRVAGLFTGGRKPAGERALPVSGRMGEFYAVQREWVEEWCEYSLNRARRLAYLSVVCSIVILAVIGYFVKVPTQRIVSFYIPLGLLLGEIIGLMFWLGQKGQSKPDKILKKFSKKIVKKFPSSAGQEAFAEDILQAGKEWTFREKKKDSMLQGVVGSRYWICLKWNGLVTIVDAERVGKIETATISGQVRSGRVRVNYVSYVVRIFYRNAAPQKNCDEVFSFEKSDTMSRFMALVRKRDSGNIQIMAES